jgi:hypothetical protein
MSLVAQEEGSKCRSLFQIGIHVFNFKRLDFGKILDLLLLFMDGSQQAAAEICQIASSPSMGRSRSGHPWPSRVWQTSAAACSRTFAKPSYDLYR